MEPTLAELSIFAFGFTPRGWMPCDGRLLPINANQSLYSLLGTTYGGDGRTTFALPDLRGRTPIHADPTHQLGHNGGTETVTLTAAQIPAHTHPVGVVSGAADTDDPSGALPATHEGNTYTTGSGSTAAMAAGMVPAGGGGGQGHDNMQPFTAVNICIAVQGLFPSRN